MEESSRPGRAEGLVAPRLQGTDVVIAIFIIVAMSFVPASFVVFLVAEKSTKGQEEKGTTEDEMVGWHHQYNGHEFEHLKPGEQYHSDPELP